MRVPLVSTTTFLISSPRHCLLATASAPTTTTDTPTLIITLDHGIIIMESWLVLAMLMGEVEGGFILAVLDGSPVIGTGRLLITGKTAKVDHRALHTDLNMPRKDRGA